MEKVRGFFLKPLNEKYRLTHLVDPRESLDDPCPGLLVQSLNVPLLALLQRGVHVDLEEGEVRVLEGGQNVSIKKLCREWK